MCYNRGWIDKEVMNLIDKSVTRTLFHFNNSG
nr:MAG TPA: hypothetical protein [Caudoviricetes sp.]